MTLFLAGMAAYLMGYWIGYLQGRRHGREERPPQFLLDNALTLIQRHHAVNVIGKLEWGQPCPVCSGFVDSPQLLADLRKAAGKVAE